MSMEASVNSCELPPLTHYSLPDLMVFCPRIKSELILLMVAENGS